MPKKAELRSSYRRMQDTKGSACRYSKKTKHVQIAFLLSTAPIFTKCLKLLQSCGPSVHVLYTELKETLTLVMNRFLKNELVTGKAGKDLMKVDLSVAENLKPLTELEIGEPTKQILQKLNANQVLGIKKEMQRFYIVVAHYLQKKLPLDNELIHDLTCLHLLPEKKIEVFMQ